APADQQLFTRDSTARAQAVAQRRAQLAAALGQIAADSSALAAAFAPAIDALSEYVAAYPADPEAAISLATLYAQSGRWARAAAYCRMRDAASLLPVAQRLLGLDPLNRASLKRVAAGWDFSGRRDSTKAYVARADSGLAVEISVSSFVADTAGVSLAAAALNL